jgi:hypothetical protein
MAARELNVDVGPGRAYLIPQPHEAVVDQYGPDEDRRDNCCQYPETHAVYSAFVADAS